MRVAPCGGMLSASALPRARFTRLLIGSPGSTADSLGGSPALDAGALPAAQLAQRQGDFLLVGLHADEDVSERRGSHLPLMDLHERSLSVLACKYVDEVVIGARPPPTGLSPPPTPSALSPGTRQPSFRTSYCEAPFCRYVRSTRCSILPSAFHLHSAMVAIARPPASGTASRPCLDLWTAQ